jgi:hypothetical protein
LEQTELRRAVDVYLALAYPDGGIPEVVKRRLNWESGEAVADLVTRAPFETIAKPGQRTVYCLRLGNARYPNMKMQIQSWPTSVGYLLSVNAHDQISGIPDDAPGMAEFREIQESNRVLKERIEQAWDEAGLPTFLRYLRSYLEDQGEGGGSPKTPTPEG